MDSKGKTRRMATAVMVGLLSHSRERDVFLALMDDGCMTNCRRQEHVISRQKQLTALHKQINKNENGKYGRYGWYRRVSGDSYSPLDSRNRIFSYLAACFAAHSGELTLHHHFIKTLKLLKSIKVWINRKTGLTERSRFIGVSVESQELLD